MWIKWTSNLQTEDEINNFRKQVFSAKPVLDRITQLLNEKEASLDKSEINPDTYTNPSWPYLQAYKNGVRAACSDLRLLLTIEDE